MASSRDQEEGPPGRSSSPKSTQQRDEIQRILSSRYDPRAVLHLRAPFSQEDIKKAYKRLSLIVHPDKNKHEGATEAFKVIAQAYQKLTPESKVNAGWSSEDLFRSFYPDGYPAGMKEHYEYLDRELLRIPQMDINEDIVHDISWFFMNLNLTVNTRNISRVPSKPFPEAALFTEYDGQPSPSTVLLTGAAGVGKTTFTKGLIHKRCHNWRSLGGKIMVYLRVVDIKGDVWEAIREHVYGGYRYTERLYQYVKSGRDGIFIYIDALDELRDEAVKANVEKFIDHSKMNGAPLVMATARDNLTGIDNFVFHRHIMIEGYTVEQGLEYVGMYYKHDPRLLAEVEKQRDTREITAILQNPLRIHMLCVAVNYDLLTLSDVSPLRLSHLYATLERLMEAREEVKLEWTDQAKSANKRMYRMCLFSVLSGNIPITKQLLEDFQIESTCPVLRFFKKTNDGITRHGYDKYVYKEPLAGYLEYCAAHAVASLKPKIQHLILMHLCSKMELFPLMVMIYEMIIRQEDKKNEALIKELTTFIRYVTILIPQWPGLTQSSTLHTPPIQLFPLQETSKDISKSLEELLVRKEWGSKIPLQTVLLGDSSLPSDLSRKVTRLHDAIFRIFDKDYKKLQEQTWLTSLDDLPFRHIHHCLQQSRPEQVTEVSEQTLGRILPIEEQSNHTIHYHATGSPRWGGIHKLTDDEISSWSPGDAKIILEKWKSDPRHHPNKKASTASPPQSEKLRLRCSVYDDLFGAAPDSAFKQSCWEALLTAPHVGHYRTLTVELQYPDLFLYQPTSGIPPAPERHHILPLLQAFTSSYGWLSRTAVEKVKVRYGYILQSKLQPLLRQFDRLSWRGRVRIVLKCPRIVMDESARFVTRGRETWRIKDPACFTPEGERLWDIR